MRRVEGHDAESNGATQTGGDVNEFWDWFEKEARPKLGIRADTFASAFKYLDKLDRPVNIIETGCVRKHGEFIDANNWGGDGCSTIMFDKYVSINGGNVRTVDINQEATDLCRSVVSFRTYVHTGDSVSYLEEEGKSWHPRQADLLYLDSFDLEPLNPLASQVHHINELNAAMPLINENTLVVVDDSPVIVNDFGMIEINGKGALVAKHAFEVNADLLFCEYQIGWTGMSRPRSEEVRSDAELKKLVIKARKAFEEKKFISASSLYRMVLLYTSDPRTGLAHTTTGVQCIARGEACLFFARLASTHNRLGTALDWYRKALESDPKAIDYRLELATKVMRPLGYLTGGRREAFIATQIEPTDKHAWRILGGFEHDLSNLEQAKAAYDTELILAPNDPEALLDRMSIALDEPDYETAERLAHKVLETDMKGEAYHSLAFIAYRQSRHEEAIELFDKALEHKSSQEATIHWNKSLALHSIGRYKEGWEEHEWRIHERTQMALYVPLLRFSKPLWKGEPAPSRLHIHQEAGAGDNLCCARYLKLLVDKGYDVRYEAYPDMVSLIARSFPDVKVIPQTPDYPGVVGIEMFDYHQPIGGLPHVFGTDIDTVPWFGPYIKSDPELAEKYRKKLNGARIGICWSAGNREGLGLWINQYGKRKSIKFKSLEPLLFGQCHLFTSLQVGPERSENKGIISDLLPPVPSWDDTAALVENLDLIISVDTSVMHLAGAMGKPVWALSPKDAQSWHLMCERPGASWNKTSPWYPTMRVFRQHRFNEPHVWHEVVEDVINALKDEG